MSAPTYAPSTTIGRSWTGISRSALRAVLLALVVVVLTAGSFFAGRATVHHSTSLPAPIVFSGGGSGAPSCLVGRPC